MFPPQFLDVDRISTGADVSSKKRLLQMLAELLAMGDAELTKEAVFERLTERERLGSTGLGHGIALPHSRMAEVAEARCAFMQLRQGIDYDAIDNRPVDLAFALLVPADANETHLQLLSALAAMFSDQGLREKLRTAASAQEILTLMQTWEACQRQP
jgi:PTS system nitrogen regulatory IIA component